jgi:hypothetical protein
MLANAQDMKNFKCLNLWETFETSQLNVIGVKEK